MALTWKLVIDSANASSLADFWASALGYEVEDPSPLIEQLLAAGRIGDAAVVEHRGHATFRGYAAIRHPEDSFDPISGVGSGRRLLFQDVSEGKSCKNRLHVDIHGEPGGLDQLVARLSSWGPPASARSTQAVPGTGGSCRTRRAMSSVRRSPVEGA
jgi:hypothetical protein